MEDCTWTPGEECALESVTFEEGVKIIEEAAFQGCSELTTVVIPASVTSIAANAFDGCGALSSVHVLSRSTTLAPASFTNTALTCFFYGHPRPTAQQTAAVTAAIQSPSTAAIRSLCGSAALLLCDQVDQELPACLRLTELCSSATGWTETCPPVCGNQDGAGAGPVTTAQCSAGARLAYNSQAASVACADSEDNTCKAGAADNTVCCMAVTVRAAL
jgi:hypothetical protein